MANRRRISIGFQDTYRVTRAIVAEVASLEWMARCPQACDNGFSHLTRWPYLIVTTGDEQDVSHDLFNRDGGTRGRVRILQRLKDEWSVAPWGTEHP